MWVGNTVNAHFPWSKTLGVGILALEFVQYFIILRESEGLMKKIIILFAFCFCVISFSNAKPWGVLQRAVSDHEFGADRLLAGKPISYALRGEFSQAEKQQIQRAFATWLQQPLQFINANNRKQEFADIVPILQRGPALIQEGPDDSTQNLSVESASVPVGDAGRYFYDTHLIRIDPNHRESIEEFYSIVLHEIGHYWGLGDQYIAGLYANSPVYSSERNKQDGSIMRAHRDQLAQFSCDDADGLINLLDLRAYQRDGHFPDRARNGWKSLCPNSTQIYKEGQPTQRTQAVARVSTKFEDAFDNRTYMIRQYRNGKLINKEVSFYLPNLLALFAVEKNDSVTRDKSGRITDIINPNFVRRFTYPSQMEKHQNPILQVDLTDNEGNLLESYSFDIKLAESALRLPWRANTQFENERADLTLDSSPEAFHLVKSGEYTDRPLLLPHRFIESYYDRDKTHISMVSLSMKTAAQADASTVYEVSLETGRVSGYYNFRFTPKQAIKWVRGEDKTPQTEFLIPLDQTKDWLLLTDGQRKPNATEKYMFQRASQFLRNNLIWLDSYYQNFYPFLFGQPATNQVRTQIKQVLQVGPAENMVK